MAIVRYVFAALKPGVDPDVYEKYEREVDYAIAAKMKTIVSYRTHRLTHVVGTLEGGPGDYLDGSRSPTAPPTRRRSSGPRRRDRRALREVSRQGEDQIV